MWYAIAYPIQGDRERRGIAFFSTKEQRDEHPPGNAEGSVALDFEHMDFVEATSSD